MARPRRAARRRVSGRILVSSSLALATVMACLAVWRMSASVASVELRADGSAFRAATEEAPTDTPPATSSPTATTPAATTDPSDEPVTSVDWAAIVATCQKSVRSRDTVIARATTGIDHWSQHTQAQTDANAGRISAKAMGKTFKRTRLLGPSDVSRYAGALDAARKEHGQCAAPDGAPEAVRAKLEQCSNRMKAQAPVLSAGARGMADWNSHQAAMRRSKQAHVDDAQQVWIDAWRTAPPNIKAFDKAKAKFATAAAC